MAEMTELQFSTMVYGFAEERGTEWDKITAALEHNLLPPAKITADEDSTKGSFFQQQRFENMEDADRIEATYQHACLNYVSNPRTTNSSLRKRFGVPDRNAATISRVLNATVDAGLIELYDPTVGPTKRHYVPKWAKEE